MMEQISIVISNFNGQKNLEDNLPSLIQALDSSGSYHEILVVDDGSTDNSVPFLKQNYSQVRVIALEKNQGYINACNRGILEAKSRLVYLMNNDVEVTSNFLNPLVKHFENKDVFAVDSREITYSENGTEIDRVMPVDYKWGIVWYKHNSVNPRNKAYPILFVHGGHTLFDKDKVLQLGGLDLLFSPLYWDCWDMSFRAWRCGWKTLYEPNSKVYHRHKTTIGQLYSEEKINTIHWEHRFLFTWKNLFSSLLWGKHLFFLPAVIFYALITKKPFVLKGLIQAIKQLPQLFNSRRAVRSSNYVTSDKDLLTKFSVDKGGEKYEQ